MSSSARRPAGTPRRRSDRPGTGMLAEPESAGGRSMKAGTRGSPTCLTLPTRWSACPRDLLVIGRPPRKSVFLNHRKRCAALAITASSQRKAPDDRPGPQCVAAVATGRSSSSKRREPTGRREVRVRRSPGPRRRTTARHAVSCWLVSKSSQIGCSTRRRRRRPHDGPRLPGLDQGRSRSSRCSPGRPRTPWVTRRVPGFQRRRAPGVPRRAR